MSDGEQSKSEWLDEVNQLLSSIEAWCAQLGWPAARETKHLTESRIGAYDAPTLVVKSPAGLIYVEPVARFVAAGEGLVDLYAWPTMRRMLLIRQSGKWILKTDSGVPWPRPWSREAFVDLVPNLAA